jgi:hypothetical protein
MTRGVDLNNPGNIEHSGIVWEGQTPDQPDPVFVKFATPEEGIRAMALDFSNMGRLHGLTTIALCIERWAPPTENDTDAYIADVCQRVGVGPAGEVLPVLSEFVKAVIHHEQGYDPYPDSLIQQACAEAA